jgi:hypothetical protein
VRVTVRVNNTVEVKHQLALELDIVVCQKSLV